MVPDPPAADPSPAPAWAFLLAGALLASWLAPRAAPGVQRPAAREVRLEDATVRELRTVPGLGETRALALVEARWRRAHGDPPLFLRDVPGVGPVSAETARAWLAGPAARSAP